jgi:NTE family protein
MDAGPLPPPRPPQGNWRPKDCDRVALVLQGGGALGAYQAGVYQALHEAGLEPDWLAGVSIGGINAAIIAGNPVDQRLARLREFWETVTARRVWWYTPDGDEPRKIRNAWSTMLTALFGQPSFFEPNFPNPWFSLRGARTATAFYDNAPLRETLLRLVDFDLLNSGLTRFASGAVNVTTGNFAYFDNARTEILPEHVMASAAVPAAMPMVEIGTDSYWDGGLVSNTPLQHLADNAGHANLLIFQVDLFSARGPLPRDMQDAVGRWKDIQYSSRTRMVTDRLLREHRQNRLLKRTLAQLPEDALDEEQLAAKHRLSDMPQFTILQMIYQQAAYEGQSRHFEFSGTSMREHWDSGYRDTNRTLRRKRWLAMPGEDGGIAVHDVHRVED